MQYKVGDIIVSASGSSYIGEIIYISKEEDVVRHRCRKTGTEYEKSYFGFQCRYMSIEERLEKDKEFCTENIQLHQQVIKLEQERDEAWAERDHERMVANEQLARAHDAVRERDEAREECAELRDYAETVGLRAVTDASETYKVVVGERDIAEAEVEQLRAEVERLRAEIEALKYPRAYIPPGDERARALSALMISQAETEIRSLRAEVEMLRGVGCREAKLEEPESGPCGVCLKCAEERGAEWAIAQAHREVCFAVDQERAQINVRRLTSWEVCRDARGKR